MKLYRKSRNLIPFPYDNGGMAYYPRGIEFTVGNDGAIILNGKNSGSGVSNYAFVANITLKAGTYTCSISSAVERNVFLQIRTVDDKYITIHNGSPAKFTYDTDFTMKGLYIVVSSGNTTVFNNTPVTVMLNEGTTALPYEPYAGQRVKLLYGSKNLIPYPYYHSGGTIGGINFVVNADNSITLNGTVDSNVITSVSDFTLAYRFKLPVGTYTLSGCPKGGGTYTYRLFININYDTASPRYVTDRGAGATFTVNEGDSLQISIRIGKDLGTVENLTFYPMLVKGDKVQPYDKYFPLSKMDLYLKSRNLINFGTVGKTGTVSGVTYEYLADGGVKLNGKATAIGIISNHLLGISPWKIRAGTYNLSCGGGSEDYALYVQGKLVEDDSINIESFYKKGKTFILNQDYNFRFNIRFGAEQTFTDKIVYPMLNEGDTALPYEPPQEYPKEK